jgi:ribosomal protein S17E
VRERPSAAPCPRSRLTAFLPPPLLSPSPSSPALAPLLAPPNSQGRVRTNTVKRSARTIVERYYGKLTTDFDTNKRVTDEVAAVPSKRMRNKIAGYVTHLMRRIEGGDNVRGISLKLQEEERERRMDFIPDQVRPGNWGRSFDGRKTRRRRGCARALAAALFVLSI